MKGNISREASENEIRTKVLAEPGPELLMPILQATNYVLVIEDFHYLPDSEKALLFQQWKRFIDNEVSVIVLGTTHRAVDIANSNRDLVGRIAQIDIGHWSDDDLIKICDQGASHLKIKLLPEHKKLVASEAVGLPIIVQQTWQTLLTSKGYEFSDQLKNNLKFQTNDVEAALNKVATTKYTQFESYYSTLIRGPREKSRKYKTYELVLACFTLDPIKFSLNRTEVDYRITKLKLSANEIPPPASLNSTFGALKKFQEKRGFNLLEWIPSEEILYIIEPAFLFYVRWRRLKETQPAQLDLFEKLIVKNWSLFTPLIRDHSSNDGSELKKLP